MLIDPLGHCPFEDKCADANQTDPALHTWLTDLLKAATESSSLNTSCFGDIQDPQNATSFGSVNYTSYCDADVYPKALFSISGPSSDSPTAAPSPATKGSTSGEDDDKETTMIIAVSSVLASVVFVAVVAAFYFCVCSSKMGKGEEKGLFGNRAASSSGPSQDNEL